MGQGGSGVNEEQKREKFDELREKYNIPNFITVYDTAEILGVSVKDTRKKCAEKEIEAHQRLEGSEKWYIDTIQFMNHANWDEFVAKRAKIKEKSLRLAQKMIEVLEEGEIEESGGGRHGI